MSAPVKRYVKGVKGVLHYTKARGGKAHLLTFHGYGQSQQFLTPFDVLKGQFNLYNFDLPFHGNSSWRGDQPINKCDIRDLFEKFLKDEGVDKFSILGFSLGGKFLLTLLEYYHERIEKIVFIAPDGVTVSPWYRFATSSRLSIRLFRFLVYQPKPFFGLTSFLRSVRLMDKSTLKFVETHMSDVNKRKHVFDVWVNYKRLKFEVNQISHLLNANDIRTYLYLGEYDRVIPANQFVHFSRMIKRIHHINLPVGHNRLLETVAGRIAQDLEKY